MHDWKKRGFNRMGAGFQLATDGVVNPTVYGTVRGQQGWGQVGYADTPEQLEAIRKKRMTAGLDRPESWQEQNAPDPAKEAEEKKRKEAQAAFYASKKGQARH